MNKTPHSYSHQISLIIFARYPELGKVKSRLASTTSQEFALDFYRNSLGSLLEEVSNFIINNESKIRAVIYCSTKKKEMEEIYRELYGDMFEFELQCSGDLGQKMYNAFEQELKNSKGAIIIGSDIPDLSKEILDKAYKKLFKSDTVIGETFDGGYYLLGLKRTVREIFFGMPWSTGEVTKITKSRLSKCDLKVETLEKLRDIDTEEDFKLWQKSLRESHKHNKLKK